MGRGMKAGRRPRSNQGNKGRQNQQMQQMQQMQMMQEQMEALREDLDSQEVTATAGGGAVSVKVNGKHELTELTIQPEAVDPDDLEMLQDLIIAAVNEGQRQIEEVSAREMEKLTGGLGIPGL